MNAIDSAPCPKCREFVPMDQRECPQCGASVLVELAVLAPLADGRSRYRLARALASLGEGVVPVAEAQARLAAGRGAILEGIPRLKAEQAAELARAEGAQVRIQKEGLGAAALEQLDEPARARWIAPAAALALAALGGVGWFFMSSSTNPSGGNQPAVVDPLPALTPAEVAQRGLASTVATICTTKVAT